MKLTDEQIEKAAKAAYAEWHGWVPWEQISPRNSRDWRDAIRAAAPHLQYQPEPVSGDLLATAMHEARQALGHASGMIGDIDLATICNASSRVVLDEALREPLSGEVVALLAENWSVGLQIQGALPTCQAFARMRRARLLRPKTAEQRVTTGAVGNGIGCRVDGEREGPVFSDECDAATFRKGLIAELKEEESK